MDHSRGRGSEGLGDITHQSLSVRANRLVETGFHYLAQLEPPRYRQTSQTMLILSLALANPFAAPAIVPARDTGAFERSKHGRSA